MIKSSRFAQNPIKIMNVANRHIVPKKIIPLQLQTPYSDEYIQG